MAEENKIKVNDLPEDKKEQTQGRLKSLTFQTAFSFLNTYR